MKFPKIPLNYGTIAGIAYFFIFLIIYYSGQNPLGNYSYSGIWIPIVAIYFGIKHHRDKELNGYIDFIKALGAGMFITFIFASLFNILVYSFGTFIATDVFDRHMNELIEQLEEMQAGIDQMKGVNKEIAESLQSMYNKAADEIEKHPENFTLGAFAWGDFQTKLMGGFFVSLIIALILKKKEPIFTN